MQRRNNNNKQSKRRGQNPRAQGGLIPHPPPIADMALKREVRMRFVTNAAFSGNITYQNLLDIFNVAASATTAVQLFNLVRIKGVTIWANALANQSASISLVYDGLTIGVIGDNRLHTDSSMGIEPAYLKTRPAAKSIADLYQPNSTDNAFNLNVPAGAIIDVSLSLRNALFGSSTPTQNAPVAATAGVVYVRGLDGLAIATTKFTPVGPGSTD